MNIRDINRNNFSINISIDNKKVYDINPLLDEYEELLINKLSEIFDVNQPLRRMRIKILTSIVHIKIYTKIN